MVANITFIKRDPFACMNTIRREWGGIQNKCQWCGGVKEIQFEGKTHEVRQLYEYGEVFDDSNRFAWDGKPFCCIGCRKAYDG